MQSTKRIQIVYTLVISLFWLAVSFPLSLSVLLAQARGMDLFQVGMVMGVYSLTIVLLELPTGGLADIIGRKRVSLVAYGFSLVSVLVLLFAFRFPVFLVGFVLSGVGRALSSGALDAWFVDTLKAADPEIDLQPAFASVGTFSMLALGVGTLGGSLIPDLFAGLPPDGSAVLTPLSMPLVFSLVAYLVLLLVVIVLVKEERPASQDKPFVDGVRQVPEMIGTALSLTRQNDILLLLLGVTTVSGVTLASLESFWQPHFAGLFEYQVGETFWFGVIMGGNFLFGMFGNMLITPISKAFGNRHALVAAGFHGLRGVFLIGLALQSNIPAAVALFWLVYLNMGAVNSLHSTLLNEQIPSEQRSSMLSIESLSSYVGGAFGSILLGYVAEHFSITAAWLIAGGILVLSFGLYLRISLLAQERKQPHGEEGSVFEAS